MLLERSSWAKEAVRLYFDEGLSLAQVGKLVGKHPATVRTAFLRCGLKPRSCYEASLLRFRRKPPVIESNELTIGLLWLALGDGSLKGGGNTVKYYMQPVVLRDFVVNKLRTLGLNPQWRLHPNGSWEVTVTDRKWFLWNEQALDHSWLRAQSLQFPAAAFYGFFTAEGCHTIRSCDGVVILRVDNTDQRLLEILAECVKVLGLPVSINGPYKRPNEYTDNPQPSYVLYVGTQQRRYNFEKARLMTQSPWPVKRTPTNYDRYGHLLESEVQAVYATTLKGGGPSEM